MDVLLRYILENKTEKIRGTTKQQNKQKMKTTLTTQEVAARFNELARQEMWFEIQDELFAADAKSIDPPNSPYFGYAEGKSAVRKKGEDFVKRIEAVHKDVTSDAIVCGNHFALTRDLEITVKPFGRVEMKEIMLFEVKDGKIVSEQFFY